MCYTVGQICVLCGRPDAFLTHNAPALFSVLPFWLSAFPAGACPLDLFAGLGERADKILHHKLRDQRVDVKHLHIMSKLYDTIDIMWSFTIFRKQNALFLYLRKLVLCSH